MHDANTMAAVVGGVLDFFQDAFQVFLLNIALRKLL
jgi:hypothetical protein